MKNFYDVNMFTIGETDEEFLGYAADFYPDHIGLGKWPEGYWLIRVDRDVRRSWESLENKDEKEFMKGFIEKHNALVLDEISHAEVNYKHKVKVQIIQFNPEYDEEIRKEINFYLKKYPNLSLEGNTIGQKVHDEETYHTIYDLAISLTRKYRVKLEIREMRDDDMKFFESLVKIQK